jgi:putrescine aminotransferase
MTIRQGSPEARAIYEDAKRLYIWPVISRQELESDWPLVLAEGSGARVRDVDGNEYIDLTSTVSRASALGYGDKRMADAVHGQLMRLHHAASGPLQGESVVRLARVLADITPGDLTCSVFCNSGSEANEAAMKLARLYQRQRGKPRAFKVITRWNAYHGSVGSAQEATDLLGVRVPSEPGVPGISRIPGPVRHGCPLGHDGPCDAGCADFLAAHIEHEGPELVAAVILEPIAQGNGVQIPPPGYLQRVREICDRYGVLLIADEVITGFGRTGRWFGVQHWDVQPDIMTLGKAITAGYIPLAAAIASEEVAMALPSFPDVHTYAGHAAGAVAAMTAISIYEHDGLVERAAALGEDLRDSLRELEALEVVREVRGLGLWAAVDCTGKPGTSAALASTALRRIVMRARELGVLVSQNGTSIELAPPFVIPREELAEGLAQFRRAVREVCATEGVLTAAST